MNILSWLEDQKEFPKAYWKDKDTGQVLAGCGAAHSVLSIPSSPDRLYFGGVSFSKKRKDNLWDAFPFCYFFAPAVLKKSRGSDSASFANLPPPIYQSETPDFKQWKTLIGHLTYKIKQKELDKVVVARRTTLRYENRLNPFDILRHLQNKAVNATLFLFQPSPDTAFLGATPEKLYRRNGTTIEAEAIAGTSPLEKKEQLDNDKERREFQFVKEFIEKELSSQCFTYQWEGEDRVISTTTVNHLYNRFIGRLKTISDHVLINLLHPTPAIGGYPKAQALAYLSDQEPIERGWYAAPIGWIGHNGANIAVAIRSALILGKEMHLFTAAGIVEGSDESEWKELNLKLKAFI